MKKITMLLTLLAIVAFTGCEQINPQADATATGADVQVTQGDPMAENDNDNDSNDDDDD